MVGSSLRVIRTGGGTTPSRPLVRGEVFTDRSGTAGGVLHLLSSSPPSFSAESGGRDLLRVTSRGACPVWVGGFSRSSAVGEGGAFSW